MSSCVLDLFIHAKVRFPELSLYWVLEIKIIYFVLIKLYIITSSKLWFIVLNITLVYFIYLLQKYYLYPEL